LMRAHELPLSFSCAKHVINRSRQVSAGASLTSSVDDNLLEMSSLIFHRNDDG
jgi:hypothetical protein